MVVKCAKDVGVPCGAERLLNLPRTWGFFTAEGLLGVPKT